MVTRQWNGEKQETIRECIYHQTDSRRRRDWFGTIGARPSAHNQTQLKCYAMGRSAQLMQQQHKKKKEKGGGEPSARFAITKYENKYINK